MKSRWLLWLKKIINPPVNKRRPRAEQREEHQHNAADYSTGLEQVQTIKIEYKCKHTEEKGADPKKRSRAKKFRAWIKRNFFNAMLTVFTALYATGFLFDAYITKRAYLARGIPDERATKILSGDVGVEIAFRNVGQTPVRRYTAQGWLLKEGQPVVIEDPNPFMSQLSIAAYYSVKMFLRWPDAPMDIPRIRRDEIGVGILWRIYYQDVFYIWHCEEFAHSYNRKDGGFMLTEAVSVCDSSTKLIRYNRICVPSTDKTYGVWVETWESSDATPFGPPPDNDLTPCRQKEERKKNNK